MEAPKPIDVHAYESEFREPLINGLDKNYAKISDDLVAPTEKVTPLWLIATLLAFAGTCFFVFCLTWTVWFGIGTWGVNKTIGWAWAITEFVWWIGIGHAGTLISAILLIFRQKYRTGINRSAEAMTIFAVICAGMFPIFHLGRVWDVGFIFPIPNTRGPVWVNFNSPLLWDVFAVSTYFSVSILFWYTGMIPDFATIRDRAQSKLRKWIYNLFAFGWSGTAKQWQRFESLALVLAGLCTPLVLSVHTIVSFDFATSVLPGWHTTIFPPYFVAGAIFSGFAMVETLMVITRKMFHLEDYITLAHIESMNKIIVLCGSIVGISYFTELFIAWYSGYVYEQFAFYNRILGKYYWAYIIMMTCNCIVPQFYWIKSLRRNIYVTFLLSIFVNIGMWFERFVIIVTSLADDFLPSSWSYFSPTWVDIGIFIGSIALFLFLFLIFARFCPVIAIAEVKGIFRTSSEVSKLERAKEEGKEMAGGYVGQQTVGPLDKDDQ